MGKKIILIKDFKFLEAKAEDESDIELILSTLEGLPENTILIFYSEKIREMAGD